MKFVKHQHVFSIFTATQDEIDLIPKDWIVSSSDDGKYITLLGNDRERDLIDSLSDCTEDELYTDYYKIEVING